MLIALVETCGGKPGGLEKTGGTLGKSGRNLAKKQTVPKVSTGFVGQLKCHHDDVSVQVMLMVWGFFCVLGGSLRE